MKLEGINLDKDMLENGDLMKKIGHLPDNAISAPTTDIYVRKYGEVVELTQTFQSSDEHSRIRFNIPPEATDVNRTLDVRYGTYRKGTKQVQIVGPKLVRLPANIWTSWIPKSRIEKKAVEFKYRDNRYRLQTAFEIAF